MPSLALLALYYAIYLGALGAIAPYLGAHLSELGVGGAGLGLLFALQPLGRVVIAPPLAALADRYRIGGWLLRAGTAVSTVGALGLWLASGPSGAGVALVLYFLGRTTPSPALEALTLEAIRSAGRDARTYGRVRLWGSAGFMVAALVGARIGSPILLGALLTGLAAALSWALPARAGPPPLPILPALRELAKDRFLGPFLLTLSLHGLTLSVYDAFFSVHVRALGLPADVTGWAVLLGVGVEVGVMALGARLLTRFSAMNLLGVAIVLAVPRWLLTATIADGPLLALVQASHGVTFGAFWIAGVHLMSTRAPRAIATAAQSLLAAAAYGVGALGGALLAGVLGELAGTGAIFLGMAVVSLLASGAWWVARGRMMGSGTPAHENIG